MSTIRAFDCIENKHTLYRGKKFCESLREHVKNVTINKRRTWNFKMQNMFICGKKFLKKFANDKNYLKVRDHCH